jgi:hypothetical protein
VAFLASKIYFAVKKVLRDGRKISRSQTRKSGTVMNKIAQPGKKSATRTGSAKASLVSFSPSKHPPLVDNDHVNKQQSPPNWRELHRFAARQIEESSSQQEFKDNQRGTRFGNKNKKHEPNQGRPAGGVG